jgi:pimeloyl-ACP methyl ester carboxylesterase
MSLFAFAPVAAIARRQDADPAVPVSPPTAWIAVAPAESLAIVRQGSGPTITLVPGLIGNAFTWRNVAAGLAARGYEALVVEPLGLGQSSQPKHADYTLTAQADRIASVLDSLGISQTIVVAHAVAAGIVFRLAYRRPDLVRAVLSLDGGLVESALTPGLRRALRFAPLIRIFGGRGRIRSQMVRGMREASTDTTWITSAVIDGYTASTHDVGAMLRVLKAMGSGEEAVLLGSSLERIVCPVQLLTGRPGKPGAPAPAEIALMRERMPAFGVDSLDRVGHFIQEERPDLVIDAALRMHQFTETWSWRAPDTNGR